jgi:hypothetical protein
MTGKNSWKNARKDPFLKMQGIVGGQNIVRDDAHLPSRFAHNPALRRVRDRAQDIPED